MGYFRMNPGTPGADITKRAPRTPSNSLLEHLASTNIQETHEYTQAFGGHAKYSVIQNAVEGVFCDNFSINKLRRHEFDKLQALESRITLPQLHYDILSHRGTRLSLSSISGLVLE